MLHKPLFLLLPFLLIRYLRLPRDGQALLIVEA
jgi:hypothetical protein